MQRRTVYLICGVAVVVVALSPPVEASALESLTAHMLQHLALTLVAAPLIVLGAPIRTLLAALTPSSRRRFAKVVSSRLARTFTHPVFTWTFFGAVMWISHFSPLYEVSLDNVAVHLVEHALFIGAGLLFWEPVVARDPRPERLSWPARIGYLVAAIPVQSFLGLAIYSSDRVLYDHYARLNGIEKALDDQSTAALVMWLGGDALLLFALGICLAAWMSSEARADEAARPAP